MKCIHCGSDTKLRERAASGGRCAACRHPFAFDPRTDGSLVTDGQFLRMIQAVSGDGKVRFAARNLWYEMNRRLLRGRFWRSPWGWVAGGSAAGAAGLAALGLPNLAPVALLGVGAAALFSARARASDQGPDPAFPKVTESEFKKRYLDRWLAIHGPIETLAPAPEPGTVATRAPALDAGDLGAYSFDRALVVEHDDIAAMLVANRFHFENNCAILTPGGYPHGRFDTVMAMLRKNPSLRVFALHDASVAGCAMALELREDRWFPAMSVTVVDLGLRPVQAERMKMRPLGGPTLRVPPQVRTALREEEVAWLERGWRMELAALRPAHLMRAVYQGMARAGRESREEGESDAAPAILFWGYGPGPVFGGDAGADAGAADSFG